MASKPLLICVDDDPPVLSAIRRLLRHEPFELITTVDPQEALARIGDRKVDLVIADQRMPAMAGTELLRAVRARSPGTIGVILTGHADLSEVATAMNEGAVDRLIRKPWSDEGFRELLHALLAGRDGKAPSESVLPSVQPLECGGRTAAQVMEDLAAILPPPGEGAARVVVSFQQLMKLRGSITALLKEVIQELLSSGARATLIDGSGTAGVFLELVGGSFPVVVYRSPAELPPPKRILVVEEQKDGLEFLRVLLESAGHACETAASAGDARRLLSERSFDLVLLDLAVSDAESLDVARHILEEGLRTSVIAVSGALDRGRSNAYAGLGILKHLEKPFRAREILDAIRDS